MLLALVVGCGKPPSNIEQGARDQVLHLGNGAEPQSLDPHLATSVGAHHIMSSLLEGLMTENPKTLEPEPGVAKSWVISEDRKTYTFTLREDAKWSNGDSVTAEDFVWSWNRVLTPSLGSQYTDMLYYVEGAKDYYEGKIDDFSQVGVKAIDQNTLEVVLNNPTPFFLGLLSHYSTWPVHKETVLKHGTIDDRNGQWTRPGNFVCNGPFQLKEWELNNKIVVEKNPHYWDASRVQSNEMHFYPVSNVMTEDRMFRAGQL